MSKAFTSEETPDEGPLVRPPPRLAPGEVRYVTPEGRAGFGTWVTVREAGCDPVTWRIVGPDEADPRLGRVSAHSPVGRALIGAGVGDLVEVDRPGVAGSSRCWP